MGLLCRPQAGLRLNGGGSVLEDINSIIKVCGARCLARPWGGNEDCRAGSVGSVPWAGRHGVRASPGCCAQRFSPVTASLVTLEQLLREPPCLYRTWPPLAPPCPPSFPGDKQEVGSGKGAPHITPPSSHLHTWKRQAPTSEVGPEAGFEAAPLWRRDNFKESRPSQKGHRDA